MSADAPPLDALHRALRTALDRLDAALRPDAHARLVRAESGRGEADARLAFVTHLQTQRDDALRVPCPDWPRVRRLHAAWWAACVWSAAVGDAERFPLGARWVEGGKTL